MPPWRQMAPHGPHPPAGPPPASVFKVQEPERSAQTRHSSSRTWEAGAKPPGDEAQTEVDDKYELEDYEADETEVKVEDQQGNEAETTGDIEADREAQFQEACRCIEESFRLAGMALEIMQSLRSNP